MVHRVSELYAALSDYGYLDGYHPGGVFNYYISRILIGNFYIEEADSCCAILFAFNVVIGKRNLIARDYHHHSVLKRENYDLH